MTGHGAVINAVSMRSSKWSGHLFGACVLDKQAYDQFGPCAIFTPFLSNQPVSYARKIISHWKVPREYVDVLIINHRKESRRLRCAKTESVHKNS